MTFDDGPSQFSNALMDILTANNVQVSYFLVGMQIDAFKAQINREVRVVVQAASGSERQRVATSHSTGWSGLCMSSACCCRCWRRPLPSCSRAPLLPT
jgi:peptidoglycan/xylan/chitin deacetylase (PgdA/CDA1 family)